MNTTIKKTTSILMLTIISLFASAQMSVKQCDTNSTYVNITFSNDPSNLSDQELFEKGYNDAKMYYKPKGWGLLGAGIILTGAEIPALEAVPQLTNDLNKQITYSNTEYRKYSAYVDGYKAGARAKRVKRSIIGAATGVAAAAVVVTEDFFVTGY